MPDQFSLGLWGSGGKFTIIDGTLSFKHVYGRNFRIPIHDITSATVDSISLGKSRLKIVGGGTILAELDLPRSWPKRLNRGYCS